MDSLTHILFADKLLQVAGKERSAAVASLFPQIDRQPAYFHRMYGHPYFQMRHLAAIGDSVQRGSDEVHNSVDQYAHARFVAERPRMCDFVRRYEKIWKTSLGKYDPDMESVLLAFVSHTYQDIFNNPIQAFLPHFSIPCGKWDHWDRLSRHGVEFRKTLYSDENISELQQLLFTSELWLESIPYNALIHAMIERTAMASARPVSPIIVANAVSSVLEGDPSYTAADLHGANRLLEAFEELLLKLIVRFSSRDHEVRVELTPVSS